MNEEGVGNASGNHESELGEFADLDGKYVVHSRVSEGTFSVVYKASPVDEPHKVVALKRLHPICHPERVLCEVLAMAALGGKGHVAPLLDGVRSYGQNTLVLPYFEHDSFKDFFQRINQDGVRMYMRALMESLAHIHSFGIIHRDIKPNNFLHNYQTKEFMLVDFGLAQSESSLYTKPLKFCLNDIGEPISVEITEKTTAKRRKQDRFIKPCTADLLRSSLNTPRKRPRAVSNSFSMSTSSLQKGNNSRITLPPVPRAGTRGFRAPEVLLRCCDQTTGIDIWSAGVIMLSILTGRYPIFKPEDDFDALYEIAKCIGTKCVRDAARDNGRLIDFPEEIENCTWKECISRIRSSNDNRVWDEECFNFLSRCLDVNPKNRISAEDALQHPFLANRG